MYTLSDEPNKAKIICDIVHIIPGLLGRIDRGEITVKQALDELRSRCEIFGAQKWLNNVLAGE